MSRSAYFADENQATKSRRDPRFTGGRRHISVSINVMDRSASDLENHTGRTQRDVGATTSTGPALFVRGARHTNISLAAPISHHASINDGT